MARATDQLTHNVAAAFGRLVARYSRSVVSSSVTEIILETPLPRSAVVWIGWHEGNLLALAAHKYLAHRAAIAFVPPGVSGIAMRAWLEELGVMPVDLAHDARRGLGLRQMEAALATGKDVLIAVDGPRGPRHHIAPGAVWLARATGAEMRPVGCAASSSFRLPRWDGLVIPLPGARTAITVGDAWSFRSGEDGRVAGLERLARDLHALTQRALATLRTEPALKPKEAARWR